MPEQPSAPIFDQVNIIASDLDRSLAFYRLLGLEIPGDGSWPGSNGKHHAAVETEGADFEIDSEAFAPVFNQGWQGETGLAGRVVVGFHVASREEVNERYATLVAAGHKGLQPPYDAFWGARYALVEDPDGIAVGIMSPSDPGKRGSLPQVEPPKPA